MIDKPTFAKKIAENVAWLLWALQIVQYCQKVFPPA
jgi:hypothetical protein